MLQVTYLFICLTLGVAICAASFYFGQKIGRTQKESEDNKVHLQNAVDEINRLQSFIETLTFEKEQLRTDLNATANRQSMKQTFSPFSPIDDFEIRR